MLRKPAGIAITLCASFLHASPAGHDVVHGQADVQALHNLLQITTSDKAIINWKEFSSQAGETIRFIQPSNSSAVLNRVTGGNTSTLYGQLQANGQVYLVNPNGIVIGEHARIDAGAFTASTFDVLNSDFIEGNALRFFGDSKAGVVNLGLIKTSCGDATLIGFQAENDGSIEAAGKAALVASNKVILKPHDRQRIFIVADADITPGGTIENPYLLAFNQTIEKDALHFRKDDDGVFLMVDAPVATAAGSIRAESAMVLGDYVQVLDGANIDVSQESGGGEILIGGDFQGKNETLINARETFVGKQSRLCADALREGGGGKVILWADGATGFYGHITAQGGPFGGDGGLVEVSGGILDFQGLADRSAPFGNPGTLLLDPHNVEITGVTTGNIVFGGLCGANTYCTTAVAPTPSEIASATIVANLGVGPVIVTTNDTGGIFGDLGNITVTSSIVWATTNPLTLQAANSINVNNLVNSTAAAAGGNITMTAAAGSITLGAPLGQINATNGAINLTAGTDVNLTNPILFVTFSVNSNTTVSARNNVNITGMVASVAGTITIVSDSDNSGSGSIFMSGNNGIVTNNTNNVTLSAGFGAASGTSGIFQSATSGQILSPLNGSITIQAVGPITLDTFLPGGAAAFAPGGTLIVRSKTGNINLNRRATTNSGSTIVTADTGSIFCNAPGGGSTTSTGPITYTAGTDIVLNGDSPSTLNSLTGGAITTTAGRDTLVTRNVATSGPIVMRTGRNMSLLASTTRITSSASTVTLVVDNSFPSAPNLGPGAFSMVAGSQVNSGVGQALRIFTSKQSQNSFSTGTLNGATFAAGTPFIDTPREHWCTYFPNAFFGGQQYTIFYKECPTVAIETGNLVVSDMLLGLSMANMWGEEMETPLIPPDVWRFMLIYGPGTEYAYKFSAERYWLSRRMIHYIHYPYVYKENKPLAELVPKEYRKKKRPGWLRRKFSSLTAPKSS